MADTYDPSKDPWSAGYGADNDRGTGVSVLDQLKAVGAGAASTGADIAAGTRAISDASHTENVASIADFFQSLLSNTQQDVTQSMSGDARARLESSVLSPEFWEHPVSASVLKGLNMTPGIAASVVPALMTDGLSATAGVAGVGGILGGGNSSRDTYDQTDKMSDEELQAAMPYYAGLRDMGMDETSARADANTKLMGLKPLMNAAANAAAMVLGPVGRFTGAVPEAAGAGLLKRMAVGGAEGAAGGALMSGTAEATHEDTQIQLDERTQMDPATILAATAEGAAIQGAMGAMGGVVTGAHETPARSEGIENVPVRGPDAEQSEALARNNPTPAPEQAPTVTPPVENRPVATPETAVQPTPDAAVPPEKAPVPEAPTEVASPAPFPPSGNPPDRLTAVRRATDDLAQQEPVQPEKQPTPESIAAELPQTPEPPQHVVPTELPPEVMKQINDQLDRFKAVAEREEAAGRQIKDGVDNFLQRKREELENEAWQKIVGESVEQATKKVARKPATVKNEGKHFTRQQIADRARNNELASDIIGRFEPTNEERSAGVTPVGRQLLIDRARGMIEAADKAGVRIPAKLKDTTNKSMEHNHAVALLVEAKNIAKPRKGSLPADEVNRFLSRETLLRSGLEADRRQVLADRRAEGDQKMQARSGKEVEKAAEPEAVVAPEETYTGEEPTVVGGDERTPITLKGNEVVAGKDKTGTFKVETKRRVLRRMGGLDEFEQIPFNDREDFHRAARSVKPIDRRSFSGYLDSKPARPGGINEALAPYISGRLRRLVGNIDVQVINDKQMNALHPGAHGLFVSDRELGAPRIYIHEDVAKDPAQMRHVLLHEGMHAAVEHVIANSAEARETISMMMEEMGNHMQEPVGDFAQLYGLTNVHEFMSEAMSNPDFQEMLAQVPASKELVRRLKLDSPLTLRDALVHFIRRILGIENNGKDFRLIEAALRVSNKLMAGEANRDLAPMRGYAVRPMMKPGRFNPESTNVNDLYRDSLGKALGRGINNAKSGTQDFVGLVTHPSEMASAAVRGSQDAGTVLKGLKNFVTTNDQLSGSSRVQSLIPNAREITDIVEKTGVTANKLKEEGVDLTATLVRAQHDNPKVFEQFSKLVHEQTMYGADASAELGEGRNAHLRLSKELQEKVDNGKPLTDVEYDAAMSSWEARRAHPQLKAMYDAIVATDPRYKVLQDKLFKFYENAQAEMSRGQIDAILRNYDFKGTDAERSTAVEKIYNDRFTDEFREELKQQVGAAAVDQLEATKALKVVNGPYAPLMRRGDHVVLGEYKIAKPDNAKQIDENTYEFGTRKEAHKFASDTGLHTDSKIVYYDPETGERTTKIGGISTAGGPEAKYQVKVQNKHVEFHERLSQAMERRKELEQSGLFNKLGVEERRNILSETSQFSDRGVESLLRSLATQKRYQAATESERNALRQTIREAGIRAMSDNRVQSRRLPRRFVKGASDDIARNLYDYNNSQANYRSQMKYREQLDDALKAMWDHVKANQYTDSNLERSSVANELEKRVRAPDPNEYSGGYTEWSRRLATWSYINVMGRPSHLILHQTHLPMITAPYMAGRHGLARTYGQIMKSWKEFSGAYKTGLQDTASAIADHMSKGSDYSAVFKKALDKATDKIRVSDMFDKLSEIGLIHPSAGVDVARYIPSKQLGGMAGALDHGLQRVDTIFRQLTNATEAINRFVGATAAYRMEFAKLTRAGKSEAEAHLRAVDYARQTLSDTQGLYSSTNAAPLFKNKWLRPFLQFKQFPQMMYHLLGKLAVTALKGETKEARIQAMTSLAGILSMHVMMAGALQGLPLEAFKILGMISKGIGLTDGDWTDVEQSVTRHMRDSLGKDVANFFLRGVGAQLGVDVHHRLGLNSFVTYGMPDEPDSDSMKQFAFDMVVGAPGSMIEKALTGTHKMLSGDIEGGALEAFPMQAFRDIHNAVQGKPYANGQKPGIGARGLMAIGFTPADKAHAREAQEAVFNATQEYNQQRSALIKSWVSASPAERNELWDKISTWNAGKPLASQLTKGDLIRSIASSKKPANKIDNIRTNIHNRGIARQIQDLYE